MSDSVHVWVRSLGNACRVSVDSLSGAALVLDRLNQTTALEGLTAIDLRLELRGDLPSTSKCSFPIQGSPDRTLASLETALGGADGIKLMVEPGR